LILGWAKSSATPPKKMTRIGDHAKSAPLIERGRDRIAQRWDCGLGAARPRIPPVRQISPLFSWGCIFASVAELFAQPSTLQSGNFSPIYSSHNFENWKYSSHITYPFL